ncbi:DNA sulfur modification protein DndB [Pseudokineococcus marinus]|uniref:DndB-like DNA-sulfur modification-associated protein n=1 Tax=Pseudokineococcus marinus TaxID=351215 RepID=A0A849BKJ1_9ACTN|nr:DNA sulfur modification protein DndB [Pseudokineococcus marinus]NNH21865.1 hypothetical protein [Pseudokineococcus marinus]
MTTTTDPLDFTNLSGYRAKLEVLATRYGQGARSYFDIALPLHLIPTHLPIPDPEQPFEGNRRVDLNHAQKFAAYWRNNPKWTAPPLLLDTNAELGQAFEVKARAFGVEIGVLALPHNAVNVLDILDGQHRILGWTIAARDIARELKEQREQLRASRSVGDDVGVSVRTGKIAELEALEQRLQTEYVTLQVVEGITVAEHKQAFADITNNAKGITKSKTVEFDSVSVINRVTRELAETHELLAGRIDFERDRTQRNNTALLSARNLSDIVKHVALGISGRMNVRREAAYKDQLVTQLVQAYLDTLVQAFPRLSDVAADETSPVDLRRDSLLASPTILRVLAGVFYELAIDVDDDMPSLDRAGTQRAEDFFTRLAPHMDAPVTKTNPLFASGVFEEGAMAPSSRSQDLRRLVTWLTGWAQAGTELPTQNGTKR